MIGPFSTFVWGAELGVTYTLGDGDSPIAGYGDRVRLRVTRLASETDRNPGDTLTVTARVGAGELPLVLDWLLAADAFFRTGEATTVSTRASAVDARFTRARADSAAARAFFLVSIIAVDSSDVRRSSRRERAIRQALADARAGRNEEAVLSLRQLSAHGELPVIARCVLAGALARTGRCTAYARETAALARHAFGREQPESVFADQCRHASWGDFSESGGFRAAELASSRPGGPDEGAAWFSGDQDFLDAHVVAVRDSAATNEHPPVVTLRVEALVRGRNLPRRLDVLWPGLIPPTIRGAGHDSEVQRWRISQRKGPAVGARFVVGITRADDGPWLSDPLLRWTPAEAEENGVRESIRAWTARAEERMRRKRPAKDAARRVAEAKEAALVRSELARLEKGVEVRANANLEDLVRSSDAIVITQAPLDALPRDPWGRITVLAPRAWLRQPAPDTERPKGLEVLFGSREDSLCSRWLAMPRDDRPGSGLGNAIEYVAFLRDARNAPPGVGWKRLYRPADPIAGILRADTALVRQVRTALEQRGSAPTEPDAACGASLTEFSDLDSAEVAGLQLKLSSVVRRTAWNVPGTVILACASGPVTNSGWFTPCTRPDAGYRVDYESEAQGGRISVQRMRTLLDALRAVPEIARGHVDSADPWTLSLRRTVQGGERIFETTLTESASRALSRRMAAIFAEDEATRSALQSFWAIAAASTRSAWDRTAASDLPDASPLPSQPGTGTVIGFVVDGETDLPVFLATVRVSDPDRVVRTDESGGFALRDLPAGPRLVQFYGPGFEPRFSRIEVFPDSVTTTVLRYGPELPSGRALRTGGIPLYRHTTFSSNTLWTVRVQDDRGRPIPGAYAAIADDGGLRAGLADSTGVLAFERPFDADRWLFIRAANREALRVHLDFETATADTMVVRMGRATRGIEVHADSRHCPACDSAAAAVSQTKETRAGSER